MNNWVLNLNVTTLTIYNLNNENNEHLIFGSHEIKYRHSFLMIDIFWHETWCCTYYICTTKWKSKCEVPTSNDNCNIIPCVSSWMILRYLYLILLAFGIIVKLMIAEYKCSSAFYTRSVSKKTLVTAQQPSFMIRYTIDNILTILPLVKILYGSRSLN